MDLESRRILDRSDLESREEELARGLNGIEHIVVVFVCSWTTSHERFPQQVIPIDPGNFPSTKVKSAEELRGWTTIH